MAFPVVVKASVIGAPEWIFSITGLNQPSSVAVDSQGNIYVSDTGNNVVKKYSSSGVYLSTIGSSGAGNGQFNFPTGLAIDAADNLFVADTNNKRIEKFNSNGQFTSVVISGLNAPREIEVDASGNIYIADSGSNYAYKYNSSGTLQLTYGWSGSFGYPTGIALGANGHLYITDYNNSRIYIYDPANGGDTGYLARFGSYGTGDGQFSHVIGVTSDEENNIYGCDIDGERILVFNSGGSYLTKFGSHGAGNLEFSGPSQGPLVYQGRIYVPDKYNNRVQVLTAVLKHQVSNLSASLDLVDGQSNQNIETGSAYGASGSTAALRLKTSSGTTLSDFTAAMLSDHDWSTISGGSDTVNGRAFVANLASASGVAGTHTLYVPIPAGQTGTMVRICPNALTLNAVTVACSGGVTRGVGSYSESFGNIEVSQVSDLGDGVTYWKITGLTGTGGMNYSLTGVIKDNLSRIAVNAPANHVLTFGVTEGFTSAGQTMTLKFDPANAAFELESLTLSDISFTDTNGNSRTLAAEPAADTWGVAINTVNDTIIFTTPASGSGYLYSGTQVIITIGNTNHITNPANTGTYYLSIALDNDSEETGEIAIPIVDSDQVNITGFVNTYISFDIDTSTINEKCDSNTCLNHESGSAATNYIVDLGELSSNWVNKSEDISVTHSDGLSGKINSVYFDLSTNAYNGAVVYVASANGGLQGPGNNIISSLWYDGYTITANSGRYGYIVPATFPTSNGGGIRLNGACASTLIYCGFTTTAKELFGTSGPLADGRVRMDIAAASSYVNNPGSYTDTLTFTAVSTY